MTGQSFGKPTSKPLRDTFWGLSFLGGLDKVLGNLLGSFFNYRVLHFLHGAPTANGESDGSARLERVSMTEALAFGLPQLSKALREAGAQVVDLLHRQGRQLQA